MSTPETLLHLVYIHGFQGNDTSFQSFPTHLQQYLSARIPPHLNIKVQSSLYPTYKSIKHISHATRNFLEWLKTQPPGPVILLGHSMGGLLAAEAATDPSNNPGTHAGDKPRRIVGMIAFDCPYLGLHPHVVITGIASLLPRKDAKPGERATTERDLNDTSVVKVVDSKVTDDWDSFKHNIDGQRSQKTPGADIGASQSSPSIASRQDSTVSKPSSPSLSSMADRAMAFINSDDPIARWVRKHSNDPFSAGKRWVVERFQFGICMFDPAGLRERYANLVDWNGGLWVNFWTQTRSRPRVDSESNSIDNNSISAAIEVSENDAALVESGIMQPGRIDTVPPPQQKRYKEHFKALMKSAKASGGTTNEKNERSGYHFVVLPTGLGKVFGGSDKWVRVPIEGVDDEVAAHCGLFFPHQNLDYDGFLERVGTTVIGWSEDIHRRVMYDHFEFGT